MPELSTYPRAIHYLSLQPIICSETIALISYLWSKDGLTVIQDIDKARQGLEVNP